LSNRGSDGDQFEDFAPRDQGFSLLRTKGQTVRWYARGAVVPIVVFIAAIALYGALAGPHHHAKASTTTSTSMAVTTTTKPRPVTTTTKPRPVTTTTKPRPVTTTTKPRPVTTTTKPAPTGKYKISFTCSGGQSVTVTGVGANTDNRLTITGPSRYQASGATATVSFMALAGTYVATDTDPHGSAFINYVSSGSTAMCS
jgi:cytoskeletal protein RodZ